jgi:hypothetical protein
VAPEDVAGGPQQGPVGRVLEAGNQQGDPIHAAILEGAAERAALPGAQ